MADRHTVEGIHAALKGVESMKVGLGMFQAGAEADEDKARGARIGAHVTKAREGLEGFEAGLRGLLQEFLDA